ncbi:MAG: hypothetical protein PHV82_06475 [Victivallaceae bacterium]|nr:hypothetical protein [Victivallaceae bacterium]
MKIFRITVLLTCAACAGLFSGCQVLPSAPEERPANISLAILENKMRKAMDPEGLYRESKSYVQKQMLMVEKDWEDEKNYIVEVKYKRPDKLKMTTMEDNHPTTSIIFNGKNAWIVYYNDRKRVLLQGEQLEKMKVLFALGRPDNTYQNIFKEVKLFETELDGRPYYKLICNSKFKDQPPFVVYVGMNNFLTKRIEIPPQVTSVIDRYGIYDGVIIPEQTTEIVGDSRKRYEIIMYKLNVDIDDEEFFPPIFKEPEEE